MQTITFHHLGNFRDIGGIPTADGRRVKKGVFYRSAGLFQADAHDLALLKQLGIRTIFDFRNPVEIEASPDPEIEGIQNIHAPASKGEFGQVHFQTPQQLKDFVVELKNGRIAGNYKSMPFENPGFKRMMTSVMDPKQAAFLLHCTCGKDRTGVGMAIILTMLDADREEIVRDYLLSANAPFEVPDDDMFALRTHLDEEELEIFSDLMTVKEYMIRASFEAIDAVGKDAYYQQEFGLSPADIEALKDCYLEPAQK